ncbi:MAG TPA: circadian clock protein KaiC [Euryarchaeota archaeon]|nr:circadian clock protein KaiC [Euryarchaeota archaeon]
MSDDRIKTYLGKLDELMNGGVPKGHVVLLSGMPGTMKSSLAYNILYYNAKNDGIPGLYITLEQGRDSLLQHMKMLGMDHDLVKDKLGIVDIAFLRKSMEENEDQDWLSVFKLYSENLKKNMKYEILAADSLAALEILAGIKNTRQELFHFFEWMRDLNVTTFLIAEAYDQAVGVHDEEFLADGVIALTKERQGNDMIRRIVIDKMRGTNHATGYYSLLVTDRGFELTQAIDSGF